MLKIMIGTDWKANSEAIMQLLCRDIQEKAKGRVLMVPELISHQTEREVAGYCGDTSCRYAEVLSFSRLAKRVSEETGCQMLPCLDNGGRVVAMAAAARQLHSKLKAYAAVETRPEFLTGLLDAVDEFKRSCITPEELMQASRLTEGTLAQKLEELSLILQAYNAICARGKRDPRDQMTWLLEQLEDSDFAAEHCFYFDHFPDFSQQHRQILFHLIRHSPGVTVSLCCDEPGSNAMAFEKAGETAQELIRFARTHGIAYELVQIQPGSSALMDAGVKLLQGQFPEAVAADTLQVYRAESVYAECAAVAESIISLVQEGCRYRDISIVCPDLQSYSGPIRSLLNRAHIPVYLSGTEDILEKTVIHTVLAALDAALGGFGQKEVLRYLRSVLSPLTPEQCDRMENYAVLWSVDGNRWLQPWDNHPRGLGEKFTEHDKIRLEKLNAAREKALAPLQHLRDGFKNAVSVAAQVKCVYSFLEEIDLCRRLQKLAQQMDEKGDNQNAQILNQLWQILLEALEQLHDVLAEASWDSDTFVRLLKLLLSQYDVGTIPSVLDAVTVGGISAMRCQKQKHLFVVGASEGVFPSYGVSAGVLNDLERQTLQKLGLAVNPGAIEGLQTQFSEIYEVFCGATESARVFCSDGQPSFIYNRLKGMAGKEQQAAPRYGAALTDKLEAAAYLVMNGTHSDAERLGLTRQYSSVLSGREHTLGSIRQEHIKPLYGDTLTLSASQIDRLAECRLSYFLKYGLSAKERKSAKIDPAEFGTYVHAVLEECGKTVVEKGGFKSVSLEETLQLAADISAKYFAQRFSQINSERLSYHFKKNEQEVKMIVRELWEEMQQSQFCATDFELGFGGDGKLPAVPIPSDFFDAKLRGYVDRVDTWDGNGAKYIRVVDYKTGKKDFDYCDVFNGIGLQMLLYLFALEDGAPEYYHADAIGAGVQYFPARVPLISADGVLSPEEAAQDRAKNFKRRGLLLQDESVLYAMEETDQPKRLCCKRKSDGTLTGDLASRQQFKQLRKYIYSLLKQIVGDIASGNVTPNPYTRGNAHNACAYCPYGAVCHPAEVPDRRNYKTMSAERFWEEIERKEQKNG